MRSTDAIDEGELDADWKLELLERAPTPRSATAHSLN
jgi:hypothetical protein